MSAAAYRLLRFYGKLRAGHTLPLRYCNLYTASISVSTSLKCSSIEQ